MGVPDGGDWEWDVGVRTGSWRGLIGFVFVADTWNCNWVRGGAHFLAAPRRCLRTHPNTVTAGMLPLGSDPVWLGPPRLETASRRRRGLLRAEVCRGRGIIDAPGGNASENGVELGECQNVRGGEDRCAGFRLVRGGDRTTFDVVLRWGGWDRTACAVPLLLGGPRGE